MLGLITFAPLWIAIGRCAIRCNTSSHPRVGLVVMFEKISSIKGLLVPGVLPLVLRILPDPTPPSLAAPHDLVQVQARPCARRPRSHLARMHPPIFVREPSAAERARLEAALRASDAFTVRRAQIVLASAEGRRPRTIARELRCATQTVRNGVRAFNAGGLAALTAGSSRPKSAAPVLGAAELERLRAILHQPPRAFGHARSTWTLDLLAQAAHGQGLSPTVLSGETVRQALLRLGAGWKRAKRWLTSPDPAYAQKNVGATG